jgi:undecaprenyl-diphosphatase
MYDFLYSIDLALFRLGNETLANPVGDVLFPFITNPRNFYIPMALAALALAVFGKKRGILVVLLAAAAIAAGDQLSSFVVKPLVGRIRPCTVLEHVRLLVPCGPGKSFPSSHAVNNFAVAFVVSRYYRRAAPYIFAWAALVAYSRVYIGVHYPSDVLGGALLGCCIGWLLVLLFERLAALWKHLRGNRAATAAVGGKHEI